MKLLQLLFAVLLVSMAAAPDQAQSSEIRIGAIYPLSGSHGETGQALKDAAELAVDIVNSQYRIDIPFAATRGLPNFDGTKLKVVFADHHGDPQVGATETERLIAREGVSVLTGCYHSSVSAKASEVAERENIPFLSGTSTSPGLTQRGFKWFFRATPHDELFAENFYQFLNDVQKQNKTKLDRIAIFNENTIWGTGVANAELRYAQQYDYDVVMTMQYPQNSNTLDNEIRLLKMADPLVLFQASYLSDAVLSISSYKKMGFKPLAIIGMNAGFISPGFISQLQHDAEYLFSREVWSSDLRHAKPLIGVVADLYQNRYGRSMNGNSARGFTAIMVLADALNRASNSSPEAIRDALAKTEISGDHLIMPWKGIKFDPATQQNILGQGIIVQIQQQRYHTVWPFDLAARKIVMH